MNILFTICGRAGSKGVRGKNARDFLNIPLVWYSLAAIKLYVDDHRHDGNTYSICANTDSADLIRLIERTGMPVAIIRRDAELAGDKVPKVLVIRDCLVREQQRTGQTIDMVVDLDLTSPLRRLADIDRAIDIKTQRPDVDCVFSVAEARRNPMFNMVKVVDGYAVRAIPTDFTARQQAPDFFDVNGSIYAYRPKALLKKEPATFFNSNNACFTMPDTGILDIDNERDYELMQVIASYLYKTDPAYGRIAAAAANLAQ